MESSRLDFVTDYYNRNYANGKVNSEVEGTGSFLAKNVYGKVLDCGCGPVPQIWAICVPKASEIYAVDLPKESVDFVNKELKQKSKYAKLFEDYKKIVEKVEGKLPGNYILNQINKIKEVRQADMSKKLPFPDEFFDCVCCIYSLGCLENKKQLASSLKEIKRVLKKDGKFLHINTNGHFRNNILPAYTYRGLPQEPNLYSSFMKKVGFDKIKVSKFKMDKADVVFNYNEISLISGIK